MRNLSDEQVREARLAEYREVANNFRTLTGIRFQLLSFLPVGTALVGLFTAFGKGDVSKSEISIPLSLFGLAVTLALIVYNERNDQLYNELVWRAADLERELGITDGYFSYRPGPWFKIRPFAVPVDHKWAIATIYYTSIIAWLFMLFSPIYAWLGAELLPPAPARNFLLSQPLSNLIVLITAFLVGWLFLHWFKRQKEEREKRMQKGAVEAVGRMAILKFSTPNEADLAEWEVIFSCAAELRGGETETEFDQEFATVLHRARFYLSHDLMQSMNNGYYPSPPLKSHYVFGRGSRTFGAKTAAHVIGLITDLPARWLLDVHSGRRGPKEETKEERRRLNEATKAKLMAWLRKTSGQDLTPALETMKPCLQGNPFEALLRIFLRLPTDDKNQHNVNAGYVNPDRNAGILQATFEHHYKMAMDHHTKAATTSSLLLAIVAAIISLVNVGHVPHFQAGLALFVIGVFGAVWAWKQHERYHYWEYIAEQYQKELIKIVPMLKTADHYKDDAERHTAKDFTRLFAKNILDRYLWVSLHVLVALIGLALMVVPAQVSATPFSLI